MMCLYLISILTDYFVQVGTVCDDYFNDIAATVICKEMGNIGFNLWRKFDSWNTLKSSYDIVLDNIKCVDTNQRFGNCTYTRKHNCGHGEDVFLTCSG